MKNRSKDSILHLSDVVFHDVGLPSASVAINFRFMKTAKIGSPQVIRLIQSNDPSLCPVRAFTAFTAVRPLHAPVFFFCHFNGNVLTRFQFNAVLTGYDLMNCFVLNAVTLFSFAAPVPFFFVKCPGFVLMPRREGGANWL